MSNFYVILNDEGETPLMESGSGSSAVGENGSSKFSDSIDSSTWVTKFEKFKRSRRTRPLLILYGPYYKLQ